MKKSIISIISEFSATNVTVLLKEGMNLKTDDEAFDVMEKYFEEESDGRKNDMMTLFVDELEALQKGGFLPSAVPVGEMKAALKDPAKFNQALLQMLG